MTISIAIPVYNGASIILKCLGALFENSTNDLLEVVCIDNASADNSSAEIENTFSQVRLIRQPVNLGFAGGVNAGIDAALGNVMVLLNQDCIVQPGWLNALTAALAAYPQYGIMGCTITHANGAIDHTGAAIQRRDATGIHLTDISEERAEPAEFVTGAAMAIRRSTWEVVGRFDEGYYPAYYEDADYCLRARNKGIETGCASHAHIRHLRSSHEHLIHPLSHSVNHCVARYRFVCKLYNSQEIEEFFQAEKAALEANPDHIYTISRVIAARHTLRCLPDILVRRKLDLGEELSMAGIRQLQVGFNQVFQYGLGSPEDNGRSTTTEQVSGSGVTRFYRRLSRRFSGWRSGHASRFQDKTDTSVAAQVNRMEDRIRLLEELNEYDYQYR